MAAFWHLNDSLSRADFLLASDIEGDPSKGVKMLERLAERGNVEVQLRLVEVYEYAPLYKIEPNIPAQIKWLKRVAEKGDKRGYNGLWRIYLYEGNVDEEKSLHYLLIAAQKGAEDAQRFLGICYMRGSILPVPVNYSEGLKWLRKAARADDRLAQMELAKAYRDGIGVNVDLLKSYIWFSIVARAEVVDQQKKVDNQKKLNEALNKFAKSIGDDKPQIPIKIEKGEAQTERDKIAAGLTASQLIEAQNLLERCIANRYVDFD